MTAPPSRTRAPHVRKAAGYAAAARVFAVPELLENILDYLPMQDLFLAKDTTKHWKAVIASSSVLKRTLHLSPIQPTSFWSIQKFRRPENDDPYAVERLTKNAPGFESDTGLDGKRYTSVELNPLLRCPRTHRAPDVFCLYATYVTRLSNRGFAFSLCGRRVKSPKRARQMLLTQPPCYQLTLRSPVVQGSVVVCNTGGIKIGDLLSGIRRLKGKESDLRVVIDIEDVFFPTIEEDEAGHVNVWD